VFETFDDITITSWAPICGLESLIVLVNCGGQLMKLFKCEIDHKRAEKVGKSQKMTKSQKVSNDDRIP